MIAILLILQTVGFEFLSVDPVAGRNQGGLSILGDGYEIVYNPAGLAFNNDQISTISYFNYIGGTHFGQLSHEFRSIAATAKYFNGGSLKRTDNMGNELQPSTFGVNFIDLSAGKGFKLGEKFALGGSVKFQYERIDTFTALGAGLDFGSVFKAKENINLAAVLKNIGYGIKPFISERELLPLEFGIGGSIAWSKSNLFVDGYVPVVGKPNLRLGYEYWWMENFATKIGFNTGLLEVKTGNEAINLITGMGLGLGFKLAPLRINYLFAPYAELGLTHRISISFQHNKPKPAETDDSGLFE